MSEEPAIILVLFLTRAVLSHDCQAFKDRWTIRPICWQDKLQVQLCYSSGGQNIEINDALFTMKCNFGEPDNNAIPCSSLQDVILLIMVDCQFSNVIFKDLLGDIDLKGLAIEFHKDRYANLELNFNNLMNLKRISVTNARSGSKFPLTFGKNLSITILVIDGHSFNHFDQSFENLETLKTLTIRHGPLELVGKDFLQGLAGSLESLDLSWNAIRQIAAKTFANFTSLKYLHLSKNKLKAIETGLFSDLTALLLLTLERNQMKLIEDKTFNSLVKLQFLNISYNPLVTLPRKLPFGPSTNLNVSAEHCKLSVLPHLNWETPRRLVLDLSHNDIKRISLPICPRGQIMLKLLSNNISNIALTRICHESVSKWPQYFLANNQPYCTCQLRGFLNFIRAKPNLSRSIFPDVDQLICRGSKESVTEAEPPCPRTDCPSKCTCNYTIINCSNGGLAEAPYSIPIGTTVVLLANNNIRSLKNSNPQYWNHVTHLNASYNSLDSLDDWIIPKSLSMLDVRYNNLQNLPLSLMNTIKEKYFDIYLSNNKWSCNCESVDFRNWFVDNEESIRDYEETVCKTNLESGDDVTLYIKDASVEDFCRHIVLDSSVFLALLPIAIGAILMYICFYKHTIVALLYSWKLLRCAVFHSSFEEKTYDAFVCASEEDSLIVHECKRRLEPYHRLCIPERDFPQESQFETRIHIVHAITNSRATLIIVSRNSLHETGFLTNVRCACNKRLEDDIHKLILVVVGDVSDVRMEHDMRKLLYSESVLRWGERFLWQKLRYELRRPAWRRAIE